MRNLLLLMGLFIYLWGKARAIISCEWDRHHAAWWDATVCGSSALQAAFWLPWPTPCARFWPRVMYWGHFKCWHFIVSTSRQEQMHFSVGADGYPSVNESHLPMLSNHPSKYMNPWLQQQEEKEEDGSSSRFRVTLFAMNSWHCVAFKALKSTAAAWKFLSMWNSGKVN